VEGLQSQIQELQGTIADKDKNIKLNSEQIDALKESNEQQRLLLETKENEITKVIRSAEEAQNEIQRITNEFDALEKRYDDACKTNDKSKEKDQQMSKLAEDYKTLQSKWNEAQSSLTSDKKTIADLNSQITALNQKIQSYEDKIKDEKLQAGKKGKYYQQGEDHDGEPLLPSQRQRHVDTEVPCCVICSYSCCVM